MRNGAEVVFLMEAGSVLFRKGAAFFSPPGGFLQGNNIFALKFNYC